VKFWRSWTPKKKPKSGRNLTRKNKMTIETRTTLGFGDIKGMEFECLACHSKTVIPIEKLRNPPTKCGVCEDSKQWFLAGSRDFNDFQSFARIVQDFSKAESGLLALRLEVTNSSASREAI
jgi:DNA replicative helicase MCM subunit Mcm2 (Cdc46/Mcm family)